MVKALVFDFANVLAFMQNNHLVFNEELLEFVAEQQVSSYVLSNSSPVLLESCKDKLIPPFIELFSAQSLQLRKTKPDCYITIAQRLDLDPSEILFTDDQEDNVVAAHQAGCQTIYFQSTASYIRQAQSLI